MDFNTSVSSSSLTVGERLCVAFIPLIAVIEALIYAVAGCFEHDCGGAPRKSRAARIGFHDFVRLARESNFTINEIEALHDLFKKLSSSIIDDGLIHKEELQLALFQTASNENLFLDRVFNVFNEKRNGVIEFEEFVHGINIFHPNAKMEEKIDFAFRLYDLRQTGFIEREEVSSLAHSYILSQCVHSPIVNHVKKMVVAFLMESSIELLDDQLEEIMDQTFADADVDGDSKINKEEWKAFAERHPSLLRNMTLPYLKDMTGVFPNFIFNTCVED